MSAGFVGRKSWIYWVRCAIVAFVVVSCREDRPVRPPNEAAVIPLPGGAHHPTTLQATAWGFRHPPAIAGRTLAEAKSESASCTACHGNSDTFSMHKNEVAISCIDCHGGRARVAAVPAPEAAAQLPVDHPDFLRVKRAYHVQPRVPGLWWPQGRETAANPSAPGAATMAEDVNYV